MSDAHKRGTAIKVLIAASIPALLAVFGARLLGARKKSHLEAEQSARAAEVESGPKVMTARVQPSPSTRTFSVLGEAKPYATVTLYAKVSGYLRIIQVDKGDAVKQDQLLAIVESPETDKQYDAARADARNKREESKRGAVLLQEGLLSPQEAARLAAVADVAEANVAALAAQKSYEVLRAPFGGTVTARYVDPGALVQNAANSQTSAQPVVSLSTLDHLRVQAWVDQHDAALVKIGDPVTITMDEKPGVSLAAKVTRIAGELAPKTKSMLVEIEYDNSKHDIVTGAFVHVSIRIALPPLPQVPADALILRGAESVIAVVDAQNRVHFRPVKVADTDGTTARLLEGVKVGETVALHLGESVAENSLVRPVAPPASASAAPSASNSAQ